MGPTRTAPADSPLTIGWLLWGGAGLLMVFWLGPLMERLGVPWLLRYWAALPLLGVLSWPYLTLVRDRRTDDFAYLASHGPVLMAVFCTITVTVVAVLLGLDGIRPPFGGIVPWAATAALATCAFTYRYQSRTRGTALWRVLRTDDPTAADTLIEVCSTLLDGEPELHPAARETIELSLAGALITAAHRPGGGHRLPQAIVVLDRLGTPERADFAFLSRCLRVAAMRLKAERAGDDVGYERAVDDLLEMAARVSHLLPMAWGVAWAAIAERLTMRADRAATADEAARLREEAIPVLERAVEMTPRRGPHRHRHVAVLAGLRADQRGDEHLDEAIRTCRWAARRLWFYRRTMHDERAEVGLVLAALRERRALAAAPGGMFGFLATLWPGVLGSSVGRMLATRTSYDLIAATWRCTVLGRGNFRAGEARARLPRLRDHAGRALALPMPDALDRMTGSMFRRVVAQQAALSPRDAADEAVSWADWAAARHDDGQAADAWWAWVTAVGDDLRGRVVHDKERRLRQDDGLSARAADALARAGRHREAAIALDVGRAVLLTERLHRDRDGLADRLADAGHGELAGRWTAALDELARRDREAFAVGHRPLFFGWEFGSAEYRARMHHDELLAEIAALPGFEDVDGAVDFGVLRAAAEDGPLVYLAASPERGFALVVGDADEPVHVPLPGLSRAAAAASAARLRELSTPRELDRELSALLPVLWTHVLAPVAAVLPPTGVVTLVPAGPLAELPLHAAGAAPGADGVWRDRTSLVFRYAPNARVLLRARRTAQEEHRGDADLLTVSVPAAAGQPPLRCATIESREVAAGFGPRARRPDPATVAQVLEALDGCAVWHFACHGVHLAHAPLESRLELADGPLTVREVFARPRGRAELAVLSACRTATIDRSRADELVGFPSALLQAGVGGVVATSAEVDDQAAMLLVLSFFERYRRGETPARALAGAQAWLRGATNAELQDAFPDVHQPPDLDDERWPAARPFRGPSTWPLFSYTGA